MIPFTALNTAGEPGGSPILNRVLTSIALSFRSLAKAVTNDHIVSADLSASDTLVYHGLGHSPVAIDVVGLTSGAVVFESATANPNRAKYVILQSTINTTAKLRFS